MPKTIPCFTQATRNDSSLSSSLTLPLNPDGTPADDPDTGNPYSSVTFVATINQTDAANPANAVRGNILADYADGTPAEAFPTGEFSWEGGRPDHRNPGVFAVPSIDVSLPSRDNGDGTRAYPTRFRVQLDTLGNEINYGGTLAVSGD